MQPFIALALGLKKAGKEVVLVASENFNYLVANVLTLPIVFSIAERYHKPIAVVFLSLPPIPTREFIFQAVGIKGHPWINRLSYRLLGLSYAMIRKQVNAFRKEIGLPSENGLQACLRSNMLAIVAESRVLLQRPADWPPNAHVTIIVSVLADQPVNGKIIERKGLGVHIPFKRLTPERLVQAIGAVKTPETIERCRAAAQAVNSEDGVRKAVELITI